MEIPVLVIADNQDLTRLGWTELALQRIKPGNLIFVGSKAELHACFRQHQSATVVVDIDLFDWESLDEMATFIAKYTQVNWLCATENLNEPFVHELTRKMPVVNMVLKTSSEEELSTAIIATSLRKKYYCSEVLEVVLGNKTKRPKLDKNATLLTPTEREIVHLLAQGKSTKEIANERCLSPHTVITHRKNIFRKLEINTVYELTKYAIKNGLTDFTEYYI